MARADKLVAAVKATHAASFLGGESSAIHHSNIYDLHPLNTPVPCCAADAPDVIACTQSKSNMKTLVLIGLATGVS